MDNTMGNQQEIPTQAELGWLAGIIDGEGSITMNARKKHWKGWNGFGVDMQVYVVNTDGGIIEKAVSIFRKLGVEPYLAERSNVPILNPSGKVYSSPKNILTVNINRMRDILHVLNNIHPFLGGEKKSRASIIMDFITRRIERKGSRTKNGSSWMDKEDWQLVEKFYALKGCSLKPEVRKFLNDYTPTALNA